MLSCGVFVSWERRRGSVLSTGPKYLLVLTVPWAHLAGLPAGRPLVQKVSGLRKPRALCYV